jgi:hypothetical protein
VERVQLADLDSAVLLPPGMNIQGLQGGNWMWKSPEAHAEGPIGTYSDIFSFALVVSFTTHIHYQVPRLLIIYCPVHLRGA